MLLTRAVHRVVVYLLLWPLSYSDWIINVNPGSLSRQEGTSPQVNFIHSSPWSKWWKWDYILHLYTVISQLQQLGTLTTLGYALCQEYRGVFLHISGRGCIPRIPCLLLCWKFTQQRKIHGLRSISKVARWCTTSLNQNIKVNIYWTWIDLALSPLHTRLLRTGWSGIVFCRILLSINASAGTWEG